MNNWKRALAGLLCTGLLLPVFASAAELPAESEANPGDTVTVTFRDDDMVLSETEVTVGTAPETVPQSDKSGTAVAAWLSGGKKVSDPSAVPVSGDTVYTVWRAPKLNTQDHASYINGKGDAAFEPGSGLTRGEAAKILYSLLEDPAGGPIQVSFSDVQSGEWFYTPVYTLSSLGVINGYEDGTFRPGATISRAEFVTMLSQFKQLSPGSARFTDVPAGHWAEKYILSAAAKGWVNGNPDGTFQPSKPISRAEAVKITNAALGRDASAPETQNKLRDGNVSPFADVRPSDWFYASVMEAAVSHSYSKTGGTESWTDFTYKDTGLSAGMQKVGSSYFLVDENGQICFQTPGLREIDGKLFYIMPNGGISAVPGPQVSGVELYYIQEDGSLARDVTIGTLRFDETGKYTSGNADLDQQVKEALAACTNAGMTREEMLRAGYLYIRDTFRYLSGPHFARGATDWMEDRASFIFQHKKGNCYCFAAAFYYVARQLGYEPQPVSGGWDTRNVDHAWNMIDGKIYDVEREYSYLYGNTSTHRYQYFNLFGITAAEAPFPYVFP